jgi:hypothetical protein
VFGMSRYQQEKKKMNFRTLALGKCEIDWIISGFAE